MKSRQLRVLITALAIGISATAATVAFAQACESCATVQVNIVVNNDGVGELSATDFFSSVKQGISIYSKQGNSTYEVNSLEAYEVVASVFVGRMDSNFEKYQEYAGVLAGECSGIISVGEIKTCNITYEDNNVQESAQQEQQSQSEEYTISNQPTQETKNDEPGVDNQPSTLILQPGNDTAQGWDSSDVQQTTQTQVQVEPQIQTTIANPAPVQTHAEVAPVSVEQDTRESVIEEKPEPHEEFHAAVITEVLDDTVAVREVEFTPAQVVEDTFFVKLWNAIIKFFSF